MIIKGEVGGACRVEDAGVAGPSPGPLLWLDDPRTFPVFSRVKPFPESEQ